jgi:hypothetical protein
VGDVTSMTRKALQDALKFEKLVNEFKDTLLKEDKKEKKLSLRESPSFWLNFREYSSRIKGAADILARMSDKYQDLHGATLLFGGGVFMVFGPINLFSSNVKDVLEYYETVKDGIPGLISKLDYEESLRIQEAYHTLQEQCYWSSVINCAVALEKRLFSILKSRNTKFLKQSNADLRFSLGGLIGLYIKNKSEFKTCIPYRHDNLMTLVNDYRIISAHSKQLDIDRATADAVFNLTLKFMVDDECRPVRRGRK